VVFCLHGGKPENPLYLGLTIQGQPVNVKAALA
jgi:hypothetical protein